MHSRIYVVGNFFVYSYGVCIVLGLVIAIVAAYFDKRCKALWDHLPLLIQWAAIGAVVGGRLLYCITTENYEQWYAFWQGGFCILGSLIGGATGLILFARRYVLSVFFTLDCVALYAPLVQSMARIGCLLTGCCAGKLIGQWGYAYGILTHPTQLYSALLLLASFFFLKHYAQKQRREGDIACLYIVLNCLERGCIDFWRAERSLAWSIVSQQQIIAIVLCMAIVCVWSFRKHFLKPAMVV